MTKDTNKTDMWGCLLLAAIYSGQDKPGLALFFQVPAAVFLALAFWEGYLERKRDAAFEKAYEEVLKGPK